MRSRTLQIVIFVLAVAGLLTAGVGGVAASHDEAVDDKEIVEMQTVSDAPGQGDVRVELRYHLGSDVSAFRAQIRTTQYEVVGTDGFSPTDTDGEYEWDQRTSEPTIEVRVPVNETAGGAYDYVDAGEWILTDRPLQLRIKWNGVRQAEFEYDQRLAVDGPGVAAGGMVYLGESDSYEFSSDSEQFRLVVSDAATPEWSVEEIEQRLVTASNQFDGGGRSQRLTLFVLTDPLRRGGLAISTNAAVWVHEAGLESPQTTLFHEYIHSRQDYQRTDATEWTIEGSADYFGKLLALKDGTIQYHRFHRLLERGNDYDDVVLADRASWLGGLANYEHGALALAAMDEQLRTSGGRYVDVFRAKNAAEGEISDSEFERLAAQSGNVDGFFDEYIRSTPPTISVPEPTVYDGPNTGATLDLQVSELDVQADETERVTVTITNTGTEQSLAPQLSVGSSDAVDVSLVDSDGSGVTETEAGWVFDHLPAGEQYELTLTIDAESVEGEQVEFAAADLSNRRDAVSATLDNAEPLGATLSLPSDPTVGASINATAATTPEDADIERYEFTISGPDGEQSQTSATPTATFTPETAGTYTVSVAVTAADGRTTSTEGTLDVLENETSQSGDDSTDDTDGTDSGDGGDGTDNTGDTTDGTDGTDDGTSNSDDGPAETDGTEDGESTDGFGDGFGPAVVVSGLLGVALLARYRN